MIARLDDVRFSPGRSGRRALNGVSLAVGAGEVLLVAGPSGGGKSSLLRTLAGLIPHFHGGRFAGRATVLGRDTRTTRAEVLAHGVSSVFQDPEAQAVRAIVARDVAFGLENLTVPAHEIPARVDEALDAIGALHLRDRAVSTLSGGERQRVAIAGALALRPRLLLLDEPTSQLDAEGTAALCAAITRLAALGTAVVVAEHRTGLVEHVADRIVTLRDGRIVAMPPPEPPSGAIARAGGPIALAVRGVVAGYGGVPVLDGCDLTLRSGTITALHGPNGSGKSTLARVIGGLIAPDAGTVQLGGDDVTDLPAERRHPRIGLLTQDAGRWLVRERVDDEIAFGLPAGSAVDRGARVVQALATLDLADHAARHPLDLSVGERERVALAATLAPDPDVIVLDEPSRGMDPVRKSALGAALTAHAGRGAAVLIVTHDDGLADEVADRHVHIHDGRIVERMRVMR